MTHNDLLAALTLTPALAVVISGAVWLRFDMPIWDAIAALVAI